MNKGDKSWKDYLLKSSLPLEYSTTQKLRGLGFERLREYKYERPNERGVNTIFSIDIFGSRDVNKGKITIELFVECKYRHNMTNWIFTPHEFDYTPASRFQDTFIILDGLCKSWKVDKSYINKFEKDYPLCGKGIEVNSGGSNPNSISRALSQLRYSLVKRVAEDLWDQVWDFLDEQDVVHILVPVIVTTAKLWRLRSDLTMEEIEGAGSIEDVAIRHDFMLIHEEPDNELQVFTKENLKRVFMRDHMDEVNKILKKNGEIDYDVYTRRFSDRYPSIVLVVEYDAFDKRVGNMIRFYDHKEILQTRS